MKLTYKQSYPLASRGAKSKLASQQGFPLRKLTLKQKAFYRKIQRQFSLEYGKYIQKRILWKVVTSGGRDPFVGKFKTIHSMVLNKKWLVDNMTLAPGVVWPYPNKKFLVAKMRAFKTLSHLVQARNLKVLIQTLQKLWSTQPSVWSVASGLDSLKANVLMKSGLVPTANLAKQMDSWLPDSMSSRKHTFVYPGDYCSLSLLRDSPQKENPFAKQWSLFFGSGPTTVFVKKKKAIRVYKRSHSIYAGSLFRWVGGFYQNRHLMNVPYSKTRAQARKQSSFRNVSIIFNKKIA